MQSRIHRLLPAERGSEPGHGSVGVGGTGRQRFGGGPAKGPFSHGGGRPARQRDPARTVAVVRAMRAAYAPRKLDPNRLGLGENRSWGECASVTRRPGPRDCASAGDSGSPPQAKAVLTALDPGQPGPADAAIPTRVAPTGIARHLSTGSTGRGATVWRSLAGSTPPLQERRHDD